MTYKYIYRHLLAVLVSYSYFVYNFIKKKKTEKEDSW